MSVDYINSVVDVNDNPQSPSYPALSFASPANLIMPGQAGSPFSLPVMWLGRPLGSSLIHHMHQEKLKILDFHLISQDHMIMAMSGQLLIQTVLTTHMVYNLIQVLQDFLLQ